MPLKLMIAAGSLLAAILLVPGLRAQTLQAQGTHNSGPPIVNQPAPDQQPSQHPAPQTSTDQRKQSSPRDREQSSTVGNPDAPSRSRSKGSCVTLPSNHFV